MDFYQCIFIPWDPVAALVLPFSICHVYAPHQTPLYTSLSLEKLIRQLSGFISASLWF